MLRLMRNEAGWPTGLGVSCDPKRQFGEPCVTGTRITVRTLYGMHLGGDSVASIAKTYDLCEADVVCAIVWCQEYGERVDRNLIGMAFAVGLVIGLGVAVLVAWRGKGR